MIVVPRLAFMGTPAFALPSLRLLLEHSYPVVAVVTAPDKPQGRGQKIVYNPVKEFALQHHLPLLQPADLHEPGFLADLSARQPDLIVVVAFRILPPEVFAMPRLGSFNLHASLLPRYRGAAPIQRALMNGERETGVTTFFLREKVDTGLVILQEKTPIGGNENAGELQERLSVLGAQVVLRTVQAIERGTVVPVPQRDEESTAAPKIHKDDCWIEWSGTSQAIHNQIRALSPVPGALSIYSGRQFKFYATRLVGSFTPGVSWQEFPPGTVVHCGRAELYVRTGDGVLAVE